MYAWIDCYILCYYIIIAGIPYDGSPEEVIHANEIALAIIYFIFATIGLLFVLVCLVFNIVFRNKKCVHDSIINNTDVALQY